MAHNPYHPLWRERLVRRSGFGKSRPVPSWLKMKNWSGDFYMIRRLYMPYQRPAYRKVEPWGTGPGGESWRGFGRSPAPRFIPR